MRGRSVLSVAVFLAVVSCSRSKPTTDPGALINVQMQSTVGVLLDELPIADRDRVAASLLAESEQFWRARASMQVEATYYRLVYRNYFIEGAGQLPPPPRELWTFEVGEPERRTVDGHDLVVVDYTWRSTLLSGEQQPGLAEPLLGKIGGVYEERFVLPADPELLFDRTGYACMNEEEYPPNSVDTENARSLYDHTCEAGLGDCHVTEDPGVSCIEALEANVGSFEVAMRFERVAWDSARADEVRVTELSPGGPQLRALTEGIEDNRIVYRYFAADSCAIVEGCVGGPGWRRLLQFTASMHNIGDEDLVIGDVSPGSAVVENNMVSFSPCHMHMHFNHYGRFAFGEGMEDLGAKRAFCLEATNRYSNNEMTPLVHEFGCQYQGTPRGWGDDYFAGLDCQWIDITPVMGPVSEALRFELNPHGFLCEGELQRGPNGEPTFEPTEFVAENGQIENRFVCEQREDATMDNVATTTVDVPAEGGLVTETCTRGQFGEKRNCGLSKLDDTASCNPDEIVTLSCSVSAGAPSQILRVCETSAKLGHGIPCMYRDALASATVGEVPVDVSFSCPAARDADEPGGGYSTYAAPAITTDMAATITCL